MFASSYTYGSLARCTVAEHAAFMRERAALDRQIAHTQDSTAREALELRKRLEGAEYLAITSERIAAQSEVITGERNNAEAQKQRTQATAYQQQTSELRQQWREAQARREAEQEAQREAKPLMVQDKNGQQRPLVDFVRSAPETKPPSRRAPRQRAGGEAPIQNLRRVPPGA